MASERRRLSGLSALPLDPPPFYLAKEIRLSSARAWISSLALGVFVLIVYRALLPSGSIHVPPLGRLLWVSAVTVAVFFAIRFAAYRLAWFLTIRMYPPEGGIHPAARGELPRNAFVFSVGTPVLVLVAAYVLAFTWGGGAAPELWLVSAVGTAICVRDLRLLAHAVCQESSQWIKETPVGLDVLNPVGKGDKGPP